jgi:hypothetical protein
LEKTFSRKVWLLNDGVAWVAPFTLVDKNETAQLSTHVPVGSVASAIPEAFVIERDPSFKDSFFLQDPMIATDITTIRRALILVAWNVSMVYSF